MKYIPALIIIASFVIAWIVYPQMPTQLASHWGINGQVDDYTSKSFGLYFIPCLSLGLYFLLLMAPKFDPYKKNFEQFQHYYQLFTFLIIGFLFFVYIATIIWNQGYQFNMIQVLSPGFSIIFYYAGVLSSHTHRNWFVGIRTPWTLKNDNVWRRTNQLGGRLFKLTALITLLGLIWPSLAIYFLLVPILISVAIIFGYSYYIFRKQ